MRKVFIVHGFEGRPNGAWRPWLLGELDKNDVYACALPMSEPEKPICSIWIEEISRVIKPEDEVYLVGHSLGTPAILRYLETPQANKVAGAILISGPARKTQNSLLNSFLDGNFDFEKIKNKCKAFSIIHGDNDPYVSMEDAEMLSEGLSCELIVVKDGKHLNGDAGWFKLPQCLEALTKMF